MTRTSSLPFSSMLSRKRYSREHRAATCSMGQSWVLYRQEIANDEYNFEMHSWLEKPVRNIETLLGRAYNGSGKSFYIYFRGVNTIHYDPYRHMNPYQYYPFSIFLSITIRKSIALSYETAYIYFFSITITWVLLWLLF